MRKEVYEFFDQYANQLINIINNTNDYDRFYNLVYEYVGLYTQDIQADIIVGITEILKKAKINPEKYLNYIPEFYHYQNAWLEDSNVIIHNNIDQIQCGAYMQADKLKSISIPGSVKAISPYAFYECTNLDEIKLEEGILGIDDSAFAYTRLSKKFIIPRSINYIAYDAFDDVEDLHAVVYKNSYAHKWFMNSDADESVYEVIL